MRQKRQAKLQNKPWTSWRTRRSGLDVIHRSQRMVSSLQEAQKVSVHEKAKNEGLTWLRGVIRNKVDTCDTVDKEVCAASSDLFFCGTRKKLRMKSDKEKRKSSYGKRKISMLISSDPNDPSVKTSEHEACMWQDGTLFGLTRRYIMGPKSASFWRVGVSLLGPRGAEGVRKQAAKCARACVQMCVCVIEQAGIHELQMSVSYERNDSSVKTSGHETCIWQNGKLFGLTRRNGPE